MEQQRLADYIAKINSAGSNLPEQIREPLIKFKLNLIQREAEVALHAFYQWGFPFSCLYLTDGGTARKFSSPNRRKEMRRNLRSRKGRITFRFHKSSRRRIEAIGGGIDKYSMVHADGHLASHRRGLARSAPNLGKPKAETLFKNLPAGISAYQIEEAPWTPTGNELLDKSIKDAAETINTLRKVVDQFYTSIIKGDENIVDGEFLDKVGSEPFFEWERYSANASANGSSRSIMDPLLRLEPVTVITDVNNGSKSKDAIKFRTITLKIRARQESQQKDLDAILEYLIVRMTHQGQSFFRVGDKVYGIAHPPQEITYSFAKDSKGEPTFKNKVYQKLAAGDLMLSPFTIWKIQLEVSSEGKYGENPDTIKAKLAPFVGEVDFLLVGSGSYVERSAAASLNECLAAKNNDPDIPSTNKN